MLLYAFMDSAETVLAILENGKLVYSQEVGSVEAAKEFCMSAGFHSSAMNATGGEGYDLRWIDEPAMDEKVIFASDLYHMRKKDDSSAIDAAWKMYSEKEFLPETYTEMRDVFSECLTNAQNQPKFEGEQGETTESPAEDSEAVEQPAEAPQETTPKSPAIVPPDSVTIEVEHIPTDRERELIDMICRKQSLKMELAGIQAEYNKDIKELDKSIFDYASGKAKRHVKANYVYNWAEGVRDIVNSETGEIVRTEEIPIEFMQTKMDLPVAPAPVQEITSGDQEATEVISVESESVKSVEETAGQPEEEIAIAPETTESEESTEVTEDVA